MISLLAGNLKNSSLNRALPIESKVIKVSINVSDKNYQCYVLLDFCPFLSYLFILQCHENFIQVETYSTSQFCMIFTNNFKLFANKCLKV